MKAVIVVAVICVAIAFAIPLHPVYTVDSVSPYQTVHQVPNVHAVPEVRNVHPVVRSELQEKPQIIAFQNDNDGDGTYNYA